MLSENQTTWKVSGHLISGGTTFQNKAFSKDFYVFKSKK